MNYCTSAFDCVRGPHFCGWLASQATGPGTVPTELHEPPSRIYITAQLAATVCRSVGAPTPRGALGGGGGVEHQSSSELHCMTSTSFNNDTPPKPFICTHWRLVMDAFKHLRSLQAGWCLGEPRNQESRHPRRQGVSGTFREWQHSNTLNNERRNGTEYGTMP